MHRSLRVLPAALVLAFAQAGFAQPVPAAPSAPASLTSGIDRGTADPSVRIQDDAFRAVEGKWLADTPIPADHNSIGGFEKLYDETQPQLRELIENVAQPAADPAAAADAKKIGDLYASFMDEARIDALGIKPVAPQLARIDALKTKADLAAAMATFGRLGVNVPLAGQVHQDAKDSTKYVVDYGQAGIGLPDRDYFLLKDDKRFADVRAKYEAYLAKLLTMAGEKDAAAKAKAVIALEGGSLVPGGGPASIRRVTAQALVA